MSDKKYISIPTIDNVKLPQSLINKCRAVYRKYGKYKLYDILNADLNNHAKYTLEEREAFKKLELTKRYLYLYRKAMAETLSRAYNIDQTELVEEDVKEFDDNNKCPYCGRPLTVMSQIGKYKGFPKSHYNDKWVGYDLLVLFNRYPVKNQITISLGDYLATKTVDSQLGYSFVYWSIEDGDNKKNISEIRVTEADPDTVITTDNYSAMSDEDKAKVVKKADISIFHYLDPETKMLNMYAIYQSNTDNTYISKKYTYTVSIQDIFDIYSESITDSDGNYKSAFNWLASKKEDEVVDGKTVTHAAKDVYYEFGYFALDEDKETNYVPDRVEDSSDLNIFGYNNGSDKIDVVSVFTAKKDVENANYVNYDKTIRQLAIEILTEPILQDIISDTDGNETVVGSYNFFQWSMDDEASVYILEDSNSLQKLQDIESIQSDNAIKLYALFKYNLKSGIQAYDDDCYCSVYNHYKGIDKAYSKEVFKEYYTNYEYYTEEESITQKYLTYSGYSDLDDATKAKYKDIGSGNKTLSEKQYELLPETLKGAYREQPSMVTYKGYLTTAGSGGNYIKNYKLKIIQCSQDMEGSSPKISYQNISHDSEGNKTGVLLTSTTPGDFDILYNMDRPNWYVLTQKKVQTRHSKTVWISNIDGSKAYDLVYVDENLNESFSYTYFRIIDSVTNADGTVTVTKGDITDHLTTVAYNLLSTEQQKKYALISDYYTKSEEAWYTTSIENIDTTKLVFAWVNNAYPDEDHILYDLNSYAYFTEDENYEQFISATAYENLKTDEEKAKYKKIDDYYTQYVCAKYITKNEYLGLSENNKLKCTIKRKYYTYSWNDIEDSDIFELLNTKTIAEYNSQTGILDGSYGIDTSAYVDITNEAYRIYRYYLALDKNVQASLVDIQDKLNGDDNEIKMYIKETSASYDGNNWLYPINEDNIQEFTTLYQESMPVSNTSEFRENGNIVFFKYDWTNDRESGYTTTDSAGNKTYISTTEYNKLSEADKANYSAGYKYTLPQVDYTRLKPTDNTGSDQLNYILNGIWKCAAFGNGKILIYKPHDISIDDAGIYKINSLYNFPLSLAAYKHNTSLSLSIDCNLDYDEKEDDGVYKVYYTNITLTGPSLNTYEYYNSEESSVTITDTVIDVVYTGLETDPDPLDVYTYQTTYENLTPYLRTSEYNALSDEDKVKYTKLSVSKVVPQKIRRFDPDPTSEHYKQSYYISSIPGEGDYYYALLNGEEGWYKYSELPRGDENRILEDVIYRYETDEEAEDRRAEYNNTNNSFILEMYGKDSYGAYGSKDKPVPGTNTSHFIKWYATSSAKFIRLDGTEYTGTISGGYYDPEEIWYNDSNIKQIGKVIEITESDGSSIKLNTKKLNSISYSGSVTSVTDDTTTTTEKTATDNDPNRVWWDRYDNELNATTQDGITLKNNWISQVGINFIGWVWLGWDQAIEYDDNGNMTGIKSSKTVKVPAEGIVESYVIADPENYVKQGFQRVLYPGQYNSTYSLSRKSSDTDPLSIDYTSDTKEPLKLIRYCDNPECELVKARNNKRKWSYRNMGAALHRSSNLFTDDTIDIAGFSLDEYNADIQNQTDKAEYDETSNAAFFNSEKSKLKTLAVDPAYSPTGETYDLQGFTSDTYPWHYKMENIEPESKRLTRRFLLHRGGYSTPNLKRFDFEYKYATDEYYKYRSKVVRTETEAQAYGDLYKDSRLNHAGIDKDGVNPMETRPITEYQNRYKEVLFNIFENTFNYLNHLSSPFVGFSEEEINVISSIVKDLFTYDINNPNSTEYVDFKHEIITMMCDLADYEFYKTNYWDTDSDDTYTLNKQILIDNYIDKSKITNKDDVSNSTLEIEKASDRYTSAQFKDLIDNHLKYYTVKATEDNWDKCVGRTVYKAIVERTYTASGSNTDIGTIISSFGDNPTYPNTTWVGYAKDSMGEHIYDLESSEMNTIVEINQTVKIYLVYTYGDTGATVTNTMGSYFYDNEKGNPIYLKLNIQHNLNKIWYNGESYTKNKIMTTLAALHEKIALPSEFMCCIFCYIIAPKRYNIIVDESGVVGSMFVPIGASSTINDSNTLSIKRSKDTNISYLGAVVSKPFNNSYDESSGRSTKEQYLILYSKGKYDAYSFFNDGWLRDVYGEDKAKSMFPLYGTNVIESSWDASELINVIPFSNDTYQSALALVYNVGIEFVDLYGSKWITTNINNVVTAGSLFGDNTSPISSVKLDTFNDNQKLVLLSSNGKISEYDLNTMKVYSATESNDDNTLVYVPGSTSVSTTYEIAKSINTRSAKSIITKALNIKTSNDDSILEPRVGLIKVLTYLEPVEYDGKPWILNNGEIASSATPAEITDRYYNTLTDINKDKYHIHPKLTVQYAWNTQNIDSIEIPQTIDHTYKDIYTDVLTKSTEGNFVVYRDDEEISLDTYFNMTDKEKAECKVYKAETINYTFVRLSLSQYGTGISSDELGSRLSSRKPIYMLYYKTGVEVDEKYGYKIRKTEYIVDGSDTIVSEEFNEYLNDSKHEQQNSSSSFGTSSIDKAWKTNNNFTDYSENYTKNINIISNITQIYPVNGYDDTVTNKYVPYYIISDGIEIQLIYFKDNTIYPIIDLNYDDGNELVDVISIPNEMKICLVFKNQRIVILQTSEYIPTESQIPLDNNIVLIGKVDTGVDRTVFSYLTDDDRIVNIYPRFNTDESTSLDIKIKHATDYAGFNGEKIVSILNTSINQMDAFEHIPNFKRWKVYPGNDRDSLMLSQIN